jgi:hypothetical protein
MRMKEREVERSIAVMIAGVDRGIPKEENFT